MTYVHAPLETFRWEVESPGSVLLRIDLRVSLTIDQFLLLERTRQNFWLVDLGGVEE